jgi:tRNA uridine 5-carboxymethylaminomethyl modification enzyme
VIRREYQTIVIGGGHAGVEAAWAAANILASHGCGPGCVALVTIDPSKIGVMSCNPAIGGLAKGQLVREVDALGGIMGLATDATGIQFRVLNTSKGAAVHGPRAQCDKHAYAEAVQLLLASRPEIEILTGTVERLQIEHSRVVGVVLRDARGQDLECRAGAVVLTTGTFMRGLMHTGESKTPGGRHGEAAATGISAALRELGFELGRLKTGTPPRLKRSTIDWDALEPHLGDDAPVPFSDLTGVRAGRELRSTPSRDPLSALGAPIVSSPAVVHEAGVAHARDALRDWAARGFIQDRFPLLDQVDCRASATSAASHELIRANLHRAPMYSGQIESVGPRYCPSIEDKVVRFAERTSHTVFLEPESHRDDWVYCNGISTSLPADVQDRIVRSLPGCQRAEIYRYGYAVEYDMVRPHQIHATGMTRRVPGLFLAGQINGTSGYEEAAAQGLIAGVNAARFALGKPEVVLGRDQAYIGVLMDDLVTKTPVEPYRMFTSRAEHRLLLRADNAPERLTPLAIELGLLGAVSDAGLGAARRAAFEARRLLASGMHAAIDAGRKDARPLSYWLRSPDFSGDELRSLIAPAVAAGDADPMLRDSVFRCVYAERRYEAYITRQRAEVERHREMEDRRIPETLDYDRLDGFRAEARASLKKFRPRTFGQAGRLEGLTPADITLLAVHVTRFNRAARAGDAG